MAPRSRIDKVEGGMLPMSSEKSEFIDIKSVMVESHLATSERQLYEQLIARPPVVPPDSYMCKPG